ncbi:MAG: bifunctional adenosylcobinamide kinase/adenosylcobinamide-phosphate guanylyltransferase, partial [Candidatus Mariimomonas ferrooxydans]
MNNKIVFIIGGARSGKSSFALNEASKIKGQKAFIATAEALDNEMKERIEKHKEDRGDEWDTYEEPIRISTILSDIKNKYSVIVLDCLTVWLSNIVQNRLNIENEISAFVKSLEDSSPLLHTTSTITHTRELHTTSTITHDPGSSTLPQPSLTARGLHTTSTITH